MKNYVTIAITPEIRKRLKLLAVEHDLQLCQMVEKVVRAYEKINEQSAEEETSSVGEPDVQ